jgi:hypothetical protein
VLFGRLLFRKASGAVRAVVESPGQAADYQANRAASAVRRLLDQLVDRHRRRANAKRGEVRKAGWYRKGQSAAGAAGVVAEPIEPDLVEIARVGSTVLVRLYNGNINSPFTFQLYINSRTPYARASEYQICRPRVTDKLLTARVVFTSTIGV